jgi:hypothetical protein
MEINCLGNCRDSNREGIKTYFGEMGFNGKAIWPTFLVAKRK